jgi:hypothetical protein
MKQNYLAGLTASKFTIDRNLEGISQTESLEQPPKGGNCINWNAGHILIVRQQLLSQFGVTNFLTDDETKLYISGSSPISENTKSVDIARIWEGLNTTYTQLNEAISKLNDDFFNSPIPSDNIPIPIPDPTFGKLLAILLFHEGYHTGQTGLGRRILGKEFEVKL